VHATHFGEGHGTRDGVFLVALLELIARYGKEVPDVDFVLQPGDRAKVLRHTAPDKARWLPLMLSFAVHPDYQEVGIPDPSFWGWPEMAVSPHWELTKDPDIVQWFKKSPTAFWRGGTNRRFGGPIRKGLLECPSKATPALQPHLDIRDAMRMAASKNASASKVLRPQQPRSIETQLRAVHGIRVSMQFLLGCCVVLAGVQVGVPGVGGPHAHVPAQAASLCPGRGLHLFQAAGGDSTATRTHEFSALTQPSDLGWGTQLMSS